MHNMGSEVEEKYFCKDHVHIHDLFCHAEKDIKIMEPLRSVPVYKPSADGILANEEEFQ